MKNRKFIEKILLDTFSSIGIDKPHNFDSIVDYIEEDVEAAADPEEWHSGDVMIGFRRWIEDQGIAVKFQPTDEVYWTDPDGECSGVYKVKAVHSGGGEDEPTYTIGNEKDTHIEVYQSELR